MSGMQPSSSSKASSTPGWVPPRLVRPYFMDARKWIRRYAGICFTNPETKEVLLGMKKIGFGTGLWQHSMAGKAKGSEIVLKRFLKIATPTHSDSFHMS